MLFVIPIIILAALFYAFAMVLRRRLVKPNFTGQNIWITGASSGIGEFLAYELNRLGGSLIISARNVKELERVKDGCHEKDKIKIVKLDMTDYEAVKNVTENVISDLEKEGKKLDIVIENAGVSMRCEFKDYDFQNHLSMFDVNVNGPFLHIKSFINHMIKNKSGQIVGISSAQGKLATCYRSSYAGSKHALSGILDSLRSELYDDGIKVTNILPGYVKTNVSKNAFGANEGEKFGATDKNIEKGMLPDVFAKEAAQAIYLKENEAQICRQLDFPIGVFFRNICPDLVFLGLRLNGKKQTKAIKNSE